MDDLRSLEGVGHLLSEKMIQNRSKRTRKRSTSGPTLLNDLNRLTSQTLPSNYIGASPQLLDALAGGITIGYYHDAQEPTLSKSHSSFARLDDNECPPSLCRQSNAHVSPCAVRQLSVPDEVIEESPPVCLTPFFDELQLDLTYNSDDAPLLIKTISNNSLFTLYDEEHHDSVTTSADELEFVNFEDDFMENQNEKIIGLGASGIVRKAFHFRSCNMVAIKECRSKRQQEMNAFMKEAKIYRTFEDNPNIANILGFGKESDNDTLSMAMEYMDLGSCDSLQLQHMNMAQREWVVGHIVVNTLKALVDLHRHRYVHNDVKPGNILCNKYGQIKLSDFGTMVQMKDKDDNLHKNNGTQRYQSPEKMIRQPVVYDTKTDIWSLGVTAYEMLFGEVNNELFLCNNPPKLTPKQHGISAECCDFIMACLTIDKEQRACALDLMEHEWLSRIESIPLSIEKWPWLVQVAKEPKNNQRKRDSFYNEDLLFMISALIIYYSTQRVDLQNDGSNVSLHRRISDA
eukprot:279707_1